MKSEKILIVDSHADIRDQIEEILQKHGYTPPISCLWSRSFSTG